MSGEGVYLDGVNLTRIADLVDDSDVHDRLLAVVTAFHATRPDPDPMGVEWMRLAIEACSTTEDAVATIGLMLAMLLAAVEYVAEHQGATVEDWLHGVGLSFQGRRFE